MQVAELTKGGICYDLKNTPFRTTCEIDEEEVAILHFSSKNYRDKFKELQKSFREKFDNSINQKYRVSVNLGLLPDLILYSTIEKRGFFCNVKGVDYDCLKNIILEIQAK